MADRDWHAQCTDDSLSLIDALQYVVSRAVNSAVYTALSDLHESTLHEETLTDSYNQLQGRDALFAPASAADLNRGEGNVLEGVKRASPDECSVGCRHGVWNYLQGTETDAT